MSMNKRTCLYERHCEAGALIQPFGGFDMPIQYTSIIDEHNAVRHHCGVFDVFCIQQLYHKNVLRSNPRLLYDKNNHLNFILCTFS